MENMHLLSWINDLDFHLLLLPPVHQQRTLLKYFTLYLVNMVSLEKSLATMDHRLTQKKQSAISVNMPSFITESHLIGRERTEKLSAL